MLRDWLLPAGMAFALAVFVGTLVEYCFHRIMHAGWMLGKKHAEHHRDGWGQGVLGEFWDYAVGILPVIWVGFLYSMPAGIGWAAGGIVYAALVAYAHQLQHERPELVFWMVRPVHYLHHHHHMWRHNFGILIDVWDRLFRTYQAVEWKPEKRSRDFPLRSFFQIKWI